MGLRSRWFAVASLALASAACAAIGGVSDLQEVACVGPCDAGAPDEGPLADGPALDARGDAPRSDAAPDATGDVTADVVADATQNDAADAGADAPADVGVDMGTDAGGDAGPIVYVSRIGTAKAAADDGGTASLSVGVPVSAGHSIHVGLMITTSKFLPPVVTVSDTAGNVYVFDTVATSDKDYTFSISSLGVNALAPGASINVAYSGASYYHLIADEFSGVSARDKKAAANGVGAAFDTGAVSPTTAAPELLFSVVGVQSGGVPLWAPEWTALPPLLRFNDILGCAYRVVNVTGTFGAKGTELGDAGITWMAAISTFK